MKLEAAPVQDLKRLLELFPVSSLRHAWPDVKGTKEEICFTVSQAKDYERIAAFVSEHFSYCKQHVYAFNAPEGGGFPETLCDEPATITQPNSALFIVRVRYEVVLRDPLEETTLDFLWPIRLELAENGKFALVRFVVLEKSVTPYFDRPCYVPGRSIEEKDVVAEVSEWAGARVDLHKGIKQLWDTGFMDSSQAKLKKALSMASETMDEELGIREHNPELYGQIVENTLLSALFAISDNKIGVTVFSVQPSNGYLAFLRYSEKGGTDHVISEILRNNQ
jgi:hypothetical protein